jgi:hypothetical protein
MLNLAPTCRCLTDLLGRLNSERDFDVIYEAESLGSMPQEHEASRKQYDGFRQETLLLTLELID